MPPNHLKLQPLRVLLCKLKLQCRAYLSFRHRTLSQSRVSQKLSSAIASVVSNREKESRPRGRWSWKSDLEGDARSMLLDEFLPPILHIAFILKIGFSRDSLPPHFHTHASEERRAREL